MKFDDASRVTRARLLPEEFRWHFAPGDTLHLDWRRSRGVVLFLTYSSPSSICRDPSKYRGVRRIIRHGRTSLRTPRTYVGTAVRCGQPVSQRSVYIRHSSIRRDILSDTKNLAGLVLRIGAEGFRKNDINIPSDVGRRKRGRKTRGGGREEGADAVDDAVRATGKKPRLLNVQLWRNRRIPYISPESIELRACWNDQARLIKTARSGAAVFIKR